MSSKAAAAASSAALEDRDVGSMHISYAATTKFQIPVQTNPTTVPPSSQPLSLSAYLDELWRMERITDLSVGELTEAGEVNQVAVDSVSPVPSTFPPGSLEGLLRTLYQFPPSPSSIDPATSSSVFVHLLPRHPNLLPLEQVVLAPPCSPSNSSAASELQSRIYGVRASRGGLISLHCLLRLYARPGLLSPSSLGLHFSQVQIKFILFQILSFLRWLHGKGLAHGALTPRNLLLSVRNGKVWVYITGMKLEAVLPSPATPQLSSPLTPTESILYQWWDGRISNLRYLLALNELAGREYRGGESGDVSFHPVLPWIIDFAATDLNVEQVRAARNSGNRLKPEDIQNCIVFRDLSKSKYRLKKGDEQLDFQFANSNSSIHKPYHVTEPLSELTYVMYRARVTPLGILRRLVRSNFVAAEYPSSVSKMERWTPDEAIPELFDDPSIFIASEVHKEKGMLDLAPPNWIDEAVGYEPSANNSTGSSVSREGDVESKSRFLAWHRAQLESEYVSKHLHEWIDIMFGYKLSGAAAIAAKNVPLLLGPTQETPIGIVADLPRRPAFMQLFERPHPQRRAATTSGTDASATTAASSVAASAPNLPAAENENNDPLFAELNQALDALDPSHAPTSSSPFSPTAGSGSAAVLFSEPTEVESLHCSSLMNFECFHSFHTSYEHLFDDTASYAAPSSGLMEWRKQREKERNNKLRAARGATWQEESESDEDETVEDNALRSASSKKHQSTHISIVEQQANDLFAFACIAAELHSSRPLFTARGLHAYETCSLPDLQLDVILEPLPSDWASLIRRCLLLDWRLRPTVTEMISPSQGNGAGFFRLLQPHPPHASLPSLQSNVWFNPYQALHTFLSEWRNKILQLSSNAGGIEGIIQGHGAASDSRTVEGETTLSPISTEILSPFQAPSSRLYSTSIVASGEMDPYDDDSNANSRFISRLSTPAPGTLNEAAAAAATSLDMTRIASSNTAQVQDVAFWSCNYHKDTRFIAKSSIADVLEWLLDEGLEQLHVSVPPAFFALFVPHVCDLLLAPSFLQDLEQHDLLRRILCALSGCLGIADAERIVAPSVRYLLTHAPSTAFQLSLVYSLDTMRTLRYSFSWTTVPRELLAIWRNGLLSHRVPVQQAAQEVLTQFVLINLDLSSSMTVASQVSSATTVPPLRSNEEEIFLFEILIPIFQRLGSNQLHSSGAKKDSSSGSTAANVGPAGNQLSSNERLMQYLLKLIPDLPIDTISHLVLPNVLALIEKGHTSASPTSTVSASGSRGSVSGLSGAVAVQMLAEADAKVSNGLDLLYAILPDLPNDTLHSVFFENSLIKSLFLSLSTSTPSISSSATSAARVCSSAVMRKVIQVVIYACVEFTNEKLDSSAAAAQSKEKETRSNPLSSAFEKEKAALASVVQSRFTPFLGSIGDFLRSVLTRLETTPHADGFSTADLQGFLHSVYVSLSSILGRQQLQLQFPTIADKVEAIIQEYAKQQFMSHTGGTTSAGNEQRTDLMRARQHALQVRQYRVAWVLRENNREAARKELREFIQAERKAMLIRAGLVVAGADSALDASSVSPPVISRPREKEKETDNNDSMDPFNEGDNDLESSILLSTTAAEGGINVDMEEDDDDTSSNATPKPSPTTSSTTTTTSTKKTEEKKETKKKGFFSTGIFARNNSSSSTTSSSSAASQSSANASVSVPLTTTSTTSSNVSTASNKEKDSATSSLFHHIDFAEILLPPTTTVSSSTSASSSRFDPRVRCAFRAHPASVTKLHGGQNNSGLFLSSSRSGDSAPTVKLWTLSLSSGGVRPLLNYQSKQFSASHFFLPKVSIFDAQLLMNPREAVSNAFVYCDGSQIQLVDIETHKPVVLRNIQSFAPLPALSFPSLGHSAAVSPFDPLSHRSLAALEQSLANSGAFAHSSPHWSKAELLTTGGISCFDYMSSLQSLVLGTTNAQLRWLDLRAGGGHLSAAWHHAAAGTNAMTAVRSVAVEKESAEDSNSCVDTNLIYSGLTTGEVACFDVRTGTILQQWRAHDSQVTQLLPFHMHGTRMLLSSGLDHSICLWIIQGENAVPILHQRWSGLEENARGMMVRNIAPSSTSSAASQDFMDSGKELVCTIGARLGTARMQHPRGTKKPTSKLQINAIRGVKGKSVLTAMTNLSQYDLTLLGDKDGNLMIVK